MHEAADPSLGVVACSALPREHALTGARGGGASHGSHRRRPGARLDFHRHDRDPVRLLGPSAVVAGLTLAIQRPLAGIDKATSFRDRPPVHVHLDLDLSPVKALSLQSAAAPRFPPVLADARLPTRSRPSIRALASTTIRG